MAAFSSDNSTSYTRRSRPKVTVSEASDPSRSARSDLDDTVTISRQAVDADDPSLPDWLDEAVTASTRAADGTATGHADRPMACHHLADVLVARYERRGDPADLDAALDAAREAAARGAPATAVGAVSRSTRSRILTDRYERGGATADPDEAVDTLRAVVDSPALTATSRPAAFNNLASALSLRARLTGAGSDLDEARATTRRSLAHRRRHPRRRDRPAASREPPGRAVRAERAAGRPRCGGDRAARSRGDGRVTERSSLFLNLANALARRHARFADPNRPRRGRGLRPAGGRARGARIDTPAPPPDHAHPPADDAGSPVLPRWRPGPVSSRHPPLFARHPAARWTAGGCRGVYQGFIT